MIMKMTGMVIGVADCIVNNLNFSVSLAVALGFLLDLLLGDPYWMPHPVRLMGRYLSFFEKKVRKPEQTEKAQKRLGLLLVLSLLFLTLACGGLIFYISYLISPYVFFFVNVLASYQMMAVKCLKQESMKVCNALEKQDVGQAKYALSMIVGRDTKELSKEGIIKAAVETVAENTSDGSIAPLFYMLLGGPLPGLLYKAVNTMDSMVGYKNEQYLYFGRTAAKLDDVVNYLPARLAGLLMVAAAWLTGLDGKNAFRIFRRDARKHASPNSAQTEAACAGALRIALGGEASYFGRLLQKPVIGDADREPESDDIRRANRLLYVSSVLLLLFGELLRLPCCF